MRTAVIVTAPPAQVLVECYDNDILIRTIDVSDHSLQYAEDTAENWQIGVLDLD